MLGTLGELNLIGNPEQTQSESNQDSSLDNFKNESFEGLSEEAKQEKYQDFCDHVCDDLGGIDEYRRPEIEFKSSDELKELDCEDGGYQRETDKIYLPDDRSHEETMNTIAHESRHCYQRECVDGRGNQSDPNIAKYKESFDAKDRGEVTTEQQNTDLYSEQDARSFADSYSEKLGHDYRSNEQTNSLGIG